jgi:hypothetical protein
MDPPERGPLPIENGDVEKPGGIEADETILCI